ncbi:MAG TPA: glycoside hydrolase family 2 protein, partial [Polyangia bacterium]|nr:glycoside hydrolase family 2 protein [Polyangia bacterium]
MLSHQRHPRGNPLIRTYMDRDFRRPKDFASFLYVGQVLQGIVIKYAVEAHRRAMGHNWGSLYWQLDDCWPVASWSSIDYYGRWKAEQYFARHFFAPVLVSPVLEKGVVSIFGVSDRRADTPARLSVRLIDVAGNVLNHVEQNVTLAANASRAYLTFKQKDLQLPKPKIKIAISPNANNALVVNVNTKQLARNIFLANDAVDNFF